MSKIMVIEEVGAMRVLISEWLAGEGHQVRSLPRHDAASGTVTDDAVDLVILDLPHPRSRSGEAAHAVQVVHAAYPQAAVIGISTLIGRSLGIDSGASRTLGVSRLLAKPCTREELLGAVAAAL
ncbi:hypothetical protein [Variovorax saccharolyticus]|uniref:hypothetical protein n=1 Tax=Variovorax saccharolyticus TaxID=3053516 RepID=UPI00257575C4|nr:hypothetical protein [Variovorax sp. J31P216]MDM0027446.1 hypothetical protein [Variovorax sp. J31P216]